MSRTVTLQCTVIPMAGFTGRNKLEDSTPLARHESRPLCLAGALQALMEEGGSPLRDASSADHRGHARLQYPLDISRMRDDLPLTESHYDSNFYSEQGCPPAR